MRMYDEVLASGNTSYLMTSRRVRALRRLGEAQLSAGLLAEALASAELALTAERQIVAQNPSQSEEYPILAHGLLLAAETTMRHGQFERVETLLREAHDQAQSIAKSQELEQIIPLVQTEEALGAFYARRHNIGLARASYQRLAELWQHFPAANEYVDRQKAASVQLMASLH